MKKFKIVAVFLFVIIIVSCERETVDNEINSVLDMTAETNVEIKDDTNEEDENKNEISNYLNIKDDEMEIPGVAILDKTAPKILDDKFLYGKDKNRYPKVDGSTALMPLMASIRKNALDETLLEAENETNCTKTNQAWYNLSRGVADVLIVGEMPGEVKNDLKSYINNDDSKYKKMKYAPIRREGLVFIVNKDNPVENLTIQQIIDIYTGKITNWKEVGGEDIEIEVFQREEKSGSQTIFRKIVMKDIEPTKQEVYYYPGDMDALIDTLASYDNSRNAIGYSVYYYVTEMYKNDNLKLIKVDGVMPSNETIANFSYPLLNESYVAIRLDEKEDSDAHKLYDYIRSNKGKEAIIEAGYVPVG